MILSVEPIVLYHYKCKNGIKSDMVKHELRVTSYEMKA